MPFSWDLPLLVELDFCFPGFCTGVEGVGDVLWKYYKGQIQSHPIKNISTHWNTVPALFLSGPQNSSSSQLPNKPCSSIPSSVTLLCSLVWNVLPSFLLTNCPLVLDIQLRCHWCCKHVANSSEYKLLLLSLCVFPWCFSYYCIVSTLYPVSFLRMESAFLFLFVSVPVLVLVTQ